MSGSTGTDGYLVLGLPGQCEKESGAQQRWEAKAESLGKGWAGRENRRAPGAGKEIGYRLWTNIYKTVTESPDTMCTTMSLSSPLPGRKGLENHLSRRPVQSQLRTHALTGAPGYEQAHGVPSTRTFPPQTSKHPMTVRLPALLGRG